MKINSKEFRVRPGEKVNLKEWPTIVKPFLSKEEQRKRFLERIDEPEKNWKFSPADIHERKYWKQYMNAYEACLSATTTHHAPLGTSFLRMIRIMPG